MTPVAPVDAADESAPLAALPEDRGPPGRGRRGPRPGGRGARGPAVGGQLVRRLPPLPAQPDDDRTRRRCGDGPHRRSGHPPTGTPSGGRAGPAARRAPARSPTVRAREVAQLLGGAGGKPDAAHVDDVLRRTGGNPYFVRALAASSTDATSGALADLLAGRLDALSDEARAVVQCAAVVSDLVPDRLLRHVSGLPDEAFDAAVRDAVADGVLRPDGAGYRFAHDLVRSAVSADLLPGSAPACTVGSPTRSRAGLPARSARGDRPPRRRGPGRSAGAGLVGARRRRGDAGLGAGRGAAPLRPGALGLAGGRRRRRGRGVVRGPGRAPGRPGRRSRG